MKALLIVDLQNDFCPGGALAAPKGDEIVPVVNALIDKFELIIASKDWHPEGSVHFEKWPVHCVHDTEGAAFHPGLNTTKIDEILLKGTGNRDDGYSAFEATNINLTDYLHQHQVDSLYVCGLTTEYCVKATAMDAQEAGFRTFVVEDAIMGVEQKKGDAEMAIRAMKAGGIQTVTASKI